MAIQDAVPFGYHKYLRMGVEGIADAVTLILQGDLGNAVGSLFNALPVVGAFLVMYGLIYFTGVISIFKSQEHHKYAKYLAWGVALMGLMNVDVMGFLINFLGGSLILILLLILVVSFVVGKWVNARKGHLENAAAKNEARARNYERLRDSNAQAQENKIQNKLHKTEDRTLRKIDTKVWATMQLQRTSLATVKNMISVLGRLAALGSDTKEREKLQAHLTSKMASFTRQIKEEYLDLEKVRRLLQDIERLNIKEIGEAKRQETIVKNIEAYARKVLENRVGANLKQAQDIKTVEEELEQMREQIIQLATQISNLHTKQKTMVEQTDEYIRQIEEQYTHKVTGLKQSLTNHLTSGDIPAAIADLHALQLELQALEKADYNVETRIRQLEGFMRTWKNAEDQLHRLLELETSKKFTKKARNEDNKWFKRNLNKGIAGAKNLGKQAAGAAKGAVNAIKKENQDEEQTKNQTKKIND